LDQQRVKDRKCKQENTGKTVFEKDIDTSCKDISAQDFITSRKKLLQSMGNTKK
jgi:hypothetical protein